MADAPHQSGPPKGQQGPPKSGGKPPAKSSGPSGTTLGIEGAILVIVGIIIFLAFSGFLTPYLGVGGMFGFLNNAYSWLVTIATVVALIALPIIIYSYIRMSEVFTRQTEELGLAFNWDKEKTQKNERWHRVEEYMRSNNRSDWKIAVLEADNILDEVIERMGYKGETLGDRLKSVEPSDFPYLDEAWQAHKVRNNVAHKGTNFELNRSEAEQTINIYHRIFKSLGYL